MTLAETAVMMALFGAAFPKQPIDEATVRVYADMLADVPADEAMRAARRLLATSEWCPTIAAIRQAVAAARVGASSSEAQWGEVLRAIGTVGRYRAPRFEDPLTEAAVGQLGWTALCDSENQVADRAHFYRAYEAARVREVDAANVGALEGRPYLRLVSAGTRAMRPIAAGAVLQLVTASLGKETPK